MHRLTHFMKCTVWNITSASHDFAYVVVIIKMRRFLHCTHKPTSQHPWLSMKGILGIFQASVNGPGIWWHKSPALHADGAWISQQSNACSDCPNTVNWHKQNSEQVSNFMDTDYFVSEWKFHHLVHILICVSHLMYLESSTEATLLLNSENLCYSCCPLFKSYFQQAFIVFFPLFKANMMLMCCSLTSIIFLVCHT